MISAMREKTMLPLGWALACVLMVAAPLSAQRVERQTLTVGGYVIDAELDPATHHLAANVQVSFTAPENAELVSFGFHPARA